MNFRWEFLNAKARLCAFINTCVTLMKILISIRRWQFTVVDVDHLTTVLLVSLCPLLNSYLFVFIVEIFFLVIPGITRQTHKYHQGSSGDVIMYN